MKTKKGLLTGVGIASVSAFAITICALIVDNQSNLIYAKASERHSGYHYVANVATESGTGNAEFYSCCVHHEVFSPDSDVVKDTDNTFVDRDIEDFVGGEASYDAYKYYYVSLDANGGTGGSGYINTALKDEVLPDVTIPTYADHHFLGFYDAAVGGTQYIDSDGKGVTTWNKTENNAKLYARWEEDDFVTSKTHLSSHFDYSHMNDSDPYIQTTERFSRSYAMFNVTGTKYYAEATLSLLETSGADWDGLGIGSATADVGDTARAFYYGPNFIGGYDSVCGGFTYMSNEDAIEWGAPVFTSRNWIKAGTVDKTNVKVAILRDGNDYYYLLNDSLRWFETNTKFDNTPTYPTIFAKDTSIKVTKWSVTTDATTIDAKLATQEYKRNFFVSDIRGHISYSNSDEFTFNSDYSTFFPSTAVKSIGDKALLSGDFTVEYDLSDVNANGNNDENTRVGVALMRKADNRVYTDTFFVSDKISDKAFDHRLVDYDPVTERNGPHEYYKFGNRTTAQGDNVNGHYKLTRTINGTSATLKLYFEDVEKLSVAVDFVGECYLMFGSNICSGTFKNITFTSGN